MSAVGNGPDPDGLYRKFEVRRIDRLGSPFDDPQHADCFLFVLDPEHDREAWFALSRYAELCLKRGRKSLLAHELLAKLEEIAQGDTHGTNDLL